MRLRDVRLAGSLCALLYTVFVTSACGRVGIRLLPGNHAPSAGRGGSGSGAGADAGKDRDGSIPSNEAGPNDAASEDAAQSDATVAGDAGGSSDASTDSGLDASMPVDGSMTLDAGMDAAMDSGMDAAVSCNLTGFWAAKLEVQMTWPGPVLAAGSGALQVWIRTQITQTGNTLQMALLPCNVLVPDFGLNPLIATETYGLVYPLPLFDHVPAQLVVTNAPAAVTGFLPGGSIDIPELAQMLGATMADPLTDSWPGVAALMYTDDDMDSEPGINTFYKTGTPYSFVPLDMMRTARTDINSIGARLRYSAAVSVTSCDAASGSAMVTAFDYHIGACKVAGTGANCSMTQRNFVDAQRPKYEPGAATLSLRRLTATSTCADVRAALP